MKNKKLVKQFLVQFVRPILSKKLLKINFILLKSKLSIMLKILIKYFKNIKVYFSNSASHLTNIKTMFSKYYYLPLRTINLC